MIALIIAPKSDTYRRSLLGLPVGLRVLLTAADAGAQTIEIEGDGTEELLNLSHDSRVTVPVKTRSAENGERLVIRADALLSPALLAELPLGRSLRDAKETPLAARVTLTGDETPPAALARAEAARWTPDRYHYALRLDGVNDFQQAKRALLASLVKPSDGPVSRYFNRHISLALTQLFVPLGATPNQITVLVALLGVAAAALATFPDWPMQLSGAILFQLHSIADGCDGEVARLTRRFSPNGALIDSLVDDLSNLLFFIGLSVGVARSLNAVWPLATGAIAGLAYCGTIAIQYRGSRHAERRGDKTVFWSADKDKRSPLASLLVSLLRRDVFVLLILAAVAAHLAPVAAAALPATTLGALAASARQFLKTQHQT